MVSITHGDRLNYRAILFNFLRHSSFACWTEASAKTTSMRLYKALAENTEQAQEQTAQNQKM